MTRLLTWLGLALLVGCVYTVSLYNSVRTTVAQLTPGTCWSGSGLGPGNRVYDGACGTVATSICRGVPKECNDPSFGYCGHMRWTVVDHWVRGASGGLLPVCTQGNNGNPCKWSGLNRDGGPDLHDCIVKWRKETCDLSGWREGKGGKVFTCAKYQYDIWDPMTQTWDYVEGD